MTIGDEPSWSKPLTRAFSRVHGLGVERKFVIGVDTTWSSRANTKSGYFASSAFLASVFLFSGFDLKLRLKNRG
jgi:hypothetical protein